MNKIIDYLVFIGIICFAGEVLFLYSEKAVGEEVLGLMINVFWLVIALYFCNKFCGNMIEIAESSKSS